MKDPKNNLTPLHKALMDAYREALRQSDRLNMLNRAFVHHVVAISSRKSAGYLRSRFEAESLAQETAEFSKELQRDDAVAHIVSYSGARALAVLKWLLVGSGVAVLFVIVGLVSKVAAGISLTGVVSLIFVLWNQDSWAVLDGIRGPAAARAVLEKTLDEPERKFFGLTGAHPPRRPTFVVAGVLTALLICTGLFILLRLMS